MTRSNAPPTFRIDLALPPAERYISLAPILARQRDALKSLSNRFVASYLPPPLSYLVSFLIPPFGSILFRRLHSAEQTAELEGLAAASSVPMYFLVAFNVFLDGLLGCTSGGCRANVTRGPEEQHGVRMLHFRTLDWNMDELRELVVVMEFVRGEQVLGTTVGYAGYVGVHTAVRPGLSISTNFRAAHAGSLIRLRWHQALVLWGFRASATELLRQIFEDDVKFQTLDHVLDFVVGSPGAASAVMTPCYLIFSDGQRTVVVEQDLNGAKLRVAKDFIAQTNHDILHAGHQNLKSVPAAMQELVSESTERLECIERRWQEHSKEHRDQKQTVVEDGTLIKWVGSPRTTNEMTQFACVMDPVYGRLIWVTKGGD